MDNQTGPGEVRVLDAFFQRAQLHPERVWLVQPLAGGQVQELTWGQGADQARRLAGWLQQLNLPERSTIAIISKNCAHWIICDLAIWMAGHISVPLPPTTPDDAVRRMLEHAEAKVVIIGKLDDWQRVRPGLPSGIPWVGMPLAEPDEQLLDWSSLQQSCEPLAHAVTRDPAELATIMYTAGTTGRLLESGQIYCSGQCRTDRGSRTRHVVKSVTPPLRRCRRLISGPTRPPMTKITPRIRRRETGESSNLRDRKERAYPVRRISASPCPPAPHSAATA